MLNKINMNPAVRFELQAYLKSHELTLQQAMNEQESNAEVAKIFYSGLPAMLKMAYSLEKMQTFFWNKKDLLNTYLAKKLAKPDTKKNKKKRKKK